MYVDKLLASRWISSPPGLTIDWNYKDKYVDISIPGYVEKALHRFQHKSPKKPQYAPHKWNIPIYGQKTQYVIPTHDEPILDPKKTKYVQAVGGTFLYYARAIDCTMLPALNEIASVQSKPTAKTLQKVDMLLDYAATYPDAKIRFYASDMILHVSSDAAYLVLPGARSRIAGYIF